MDNLYLYIGLALLLISALAYIVYRSRSQAAPSLPYQTPPPPIGISSSIHSEIERLLRSGQKIQAIKLYRERTGVGLKEAKDAVEAIERGQSLRGDTEPLLEPDLREMLLVGQELLEEKKQEAASLYRERSGVSEEQARQVVEQFSQALAHEQALSLSAAAPLDPALVKLLRAGEKIQAIKLYRERTGVGLKEAKDAVEELQRRIAADGE